MVCKCSPPEFSLFRGIFPRLIFSRFNIPAITRQLATLWETPSGIRVSLLRATRRRWRAWWLCRRANRERQRGILLYVREQISWIHFCGECAWQRRGENGSSAGEMMRSTKTSGPESRMNVYIFLRSIFMSPSLKTGIFHVPKTTEPLFPTTVWKMLLIM